MAAPQIGRPYNLFIAIGEVFENIHCITPIGDGYTSFEGCYSVPHEPHSVVRYRSIWVHSGKNNKRKKYDGFLAQVIQHEFDHIKGKLISD